MTLSTTVQKLRNQNMDRRALATDRNAFLSTWRNDVSAVYEQFRKALAPFVDDDAAHIIQTTTTIEEDLLGEYDIDALVIEIVERRIFLMPKARILSGATGRIDLYREDRPSESNRIVLLRGSPSVNYDPNVWLVQDRRDSTPFDKAIASITISALGLSHKPRFRALDDMTIQDSIDYVLNV